MESGKAKSRGRMPGIAITEDLRGRLAGLQNRYNFSIRQLADRSGLSGKTLRNLLSGRMESVAESSLRAVAAAFGTNAEYLITGQSEHPPHIEDWISFERSVRSVDEYVFRTVRNQRDADFTRGLQLYADLMESSARREHVDPKTLIQRINAAPEVARLCSTIPTPDIEVRVQSAFQKIEFGGGKLSLEVVKPRLLWDCICNSSAKPEAARSCPIHKQVGADEVTGRFLGGLVRISWRSVSVLWRRSPALWPPSIDAFGMIADLEHSGFFTRDDRVILDLGCGTGFLGIYTANANARVCAVDFADWLFTPIVYSAINWHLNRSKRPYVSTRFRLGPLTSWQDGLSDVQYDSVLCNPPYLPLLPGFERIGLSSTVAGTDLLVHVIHRARELGKFVCVQLSQLAMVEAKAAAASVNCYLEPLGPKRRVPFRVADALAQPDYLGALVSARGLEEMPKLDHRYWHTLQTFRVRAND